MTEISKPDGMRQLSIAQLNAVEFLLQGRNDQAVADAVGVSRQTVSGWKNHDPVFVAELNRGRSEMWRDARQRLKSLASSALDVVENQLHSEDPKTSLSAAKYILQGNRLLGKESLPQTGLIDPRAVLFEMLKSEAIQDLMAKTNPEDLNMYRIDKEADAIARSKLAEAIDDHLGQDRPEAGP